MEFRATPWSGHSSAGVNYIYWGSRRRASFGEGLKRLRPQRDQFVLVIQSYTRVAGLMAWSLERALRALALTTPTSCCSACGTSRCRRGFWTPRGN